MSTIVEQTWAELGYRVRPLGFKVFVRTEPVPECTEGGIFLPAKRQGMYGERLPHQALVSAVVCSAGPTARDYWKHFEGQRIVFQRLHFAWIQQMEDGTYFGYIDAAQIVGEPQEAEVFPLAG